MKIVFLNTLNAQVREPLAEFLSRQAQDTDVFCFQEAYECMQELCETSLRDYREINVAKALREDEHYSQATYIRNGLERISSPVLWSLPDAGIGLYTAVSREGKTVHLCNVHGIARVTGNGPDDKQDSPGRIAQTQGLLDFFKDKQGPRIIGGDFNVLPDTENIRMFEEAGYRNLIKDYHIATTRNELSWSRFPDRKLYFSDYVFVSSDARVKSFTVPDMEISDHLPMILEIV